MALCERCGGELAVETLPYYEDDLFGIPIALIACVQQSKCRNCGEASDTTITDPEGLICAAAVTRIKVSVKLTGRDIRFLRQALDCTGRELATKLGVTPETVSRWENSREPIGLTSEKLLRLSVGLELSRRAPGIDFDEKEVRCMEITPIQPTDPEEMRLWFERVPMRIEGRREIVWEEKRAA